MKTQTNNPVKQTGKTTSQPTKTNGNNPKLPNNDPDQTPDREVKNVPVAKPGKETEKQTPQKKIGFNR